MYTYLYESVKFLSISSDRYYFLMIRFLSPPHKVNCLIFDTGPVTYVLLISYEREASLTYDIMNGIQTWLFVSPPPLPIVFNLDTQRHCKIKIQDMSLWGILSHRLFHILIFFCCYWMVVIILPRPIEAKSKQNCPSFLWLFLYICEELTKRISFQRGSRCGANLNVYVHC